MPDFRDRSDELRAAHAGADDARADLLAARNALRGARADARHAQRVAEDDRTRAEAERRVKEAEAGVAIASEAATRAAAAASRAVEAFATLADPRERAAEWDDREPVLLFPLRLETRWLGGELLVRVFPDDCLVDSFEPDLSEREYDAVERYWIDVWRAGAEEVGQRAAWRGLVASLGSGRGDFVARRHEPLNAEAERPVKAAPDDVVLVVDDRPQLSSAEVGALATYWAAIWRAGDDAQAGQHARAALEAAVGSASRADELVEQYAPGNLADSPAPPLTRDDVDVQVAFLRLPDRPAAASGTSWNRPPTAELLPERFVLLGYLGGELVLEQLGAALPERVVVGPDPSDEGALGSVDGTLKTPDELRWLFDFERAVRDGLGFRVALDDTTAGGLDRLLVVGLRTNSDAAQAKDELEALLTHHRHGRAGFDLLAQGTPTNNTEQLSSGLQRGDDPDATFRDPFDPVPTFTPTADPLERRDGEWLAQWLGVDPAVVAPLAGAGGRDQLEARAMQTALWPATLGSMLGTLLQPVLDERELEDARRFFTTYVTGRGPIPAVRVGSQPYGIVPSTAFSRMAFGRKDAFLERLHGLLTITRADWAALAAGVGRVGLGDDPQGRLLDVIGLNATSVEYHQRYAESLDDLYNRVNLWGAGATWLAAFQASGRLDDGLALLRRLGYDGEATPDILERIFFGAQQRLQGPLIDDRPLSESEPIRAYTADGRNFVEWLADAGRTSLDAVRREDGLEDDTPAALLYLLMRHAVLLGYWDTAVRLRFDAGEIDVATVALLREEQPFVHVAQQAPEGVGESRFAELYRADAVITGDDTTLVGDHITAVLGGETPGVRLLDDQLAALDRLRDTPTARLERLLAEHVDACSYRLDAWSTGLVHQRLATLGERTGIHIGAFGWLEDVRPRPRDLQPVILDEDLAEVFDTDGTSPLVTDSTNAGHMHAPSLNHAVTAAVLRSGFLANATPATPDAFAVDLSSRRVRPALEVIEGMRNGQSLGALLGYRLERGLHDRHAVAEVDAFVFALRKAFPLVADRLDETKTDDDVAIEAIEARNVVDGLALVTHVRQSGNRSYPFGLTMPAATPAQAAAVDAEVAALLGLHDAIADLTLAEGVHQAVVGNVDRAAATLDAFGKASLPLEPQVVQTPRSGIAITHRVAIHVQPQSDPLQSPISGMPVTPRAIGEPALNAWLAGRLPAPAAVACTVDWDNPATGAPVSATVTQADLGLQPLDLLSLLSVSDEQAMGELDARVLLHVERTASPRPDARPRVIYTKRVPGKATTFFEIAPLAESLRALVLRSRPLRASDAALPNEARQAMDAAVDVDPGRATEVKDRLEAVATALRATASDPRLADPPGNRAALLNGIDALLDDLTDELADAAGFGLPQTDWSDLAAFRSELFADVLGAAEALVARFDERLDRFDELIDRYDGLPGSPTDAEHILILKQAELVVATSPTTPVPSDFKTAVLARRATFAQKRAQFHALQATAAGTLSDLLDAVSALLPLDALDAEGFDLAPFEDRIVKYASSMAARATSVADAIDARAAAAQTALDASAASASGPARVAALEEAHRALLGDDARLLPELALGAEHGAEWRNAVVASESGAPFAHLAADHDVPVDDWLHGLARVREKLGHWEQTLLMSAPLGLEEPGLTPVQLPYVDGDPWLGLEYPPATVVDSERLLYTAHYDAPFDPTEPQCGLLIDEWTEVLPSELQTTGLAFHFDRPSSEPPQAWLLVVPPEPTGAWAWADIVDAVHETLDAARLRAVEPDQIDGTAWARLLPAIVTVTTLHPITIAIDYARMNGSLTLMEADDG